MEGYSIHMAKAFIRESGRKREQNREGVRTCKGHFRETARWSAVIEIKMNTR